MEEKPQTPQMPRLGITQGDINGIAYEIILKAFSDSRMLMEMIPVLYGQSKVLSYYKKNFGIEDFNYSLTRDVRQAWAQKFNILNVVEHELKIDPGQVTALSADMAVLSLKMAAEDLKNGCLDALVMAPACRSVDGTQGDFLASTFGKPNTLRLLVSDFMRMGLATDDRSLHEALGMLNSDFIAQKLNVLSQALKTDFGLNAPKIAVMGLDPHSGEKDFVKADDVVTKALVEAKKNDVLAYGPFSAARLFVTGDWKKYDAVMALTYDQGVLPFKLMSVNGYAYYWAGLPSVCTGPLHGPAFDMANTNTATPDAIRKAVYLAMDILRHRRENDE